MNISPRTSLKSPAAPIPNDIANLKRTGFIKKAIIDYEQTALIYRNLGHEKKFQEKPDYNRYKKEQSWYEKVKSKRTGEYNQAEDLIKRELVPENWQPQHVDKEGKPVKYPIKYVNEIIRKRLVDWRSAVPIVLRSL